VKLWIDAGVSVKGAPEHLFVKLYTHGTQEGVMKMLFDDGGWQRFFDGIEKYVNDNNVKVHFVSAKEMVNKIMGSVANISCLHP
jgi:hypothetical protein